MNDHDHAASDEDPERLGRAYQSVLRAWIDRFRRSQAALRELEDELEDRERDAFMAGWKAAVANATSLTSGRYHTPAEAHREWRAEEERP